MRWRGCVSILLAACCLLSARSIAQDNALNALGPAGQTHPLSAHVTDVATRLGLYIRGILERLVSLFRGLHLWGSSSLTYASSTDGTGTAEAFRRDNRGVLQWNGARATTRELEALVYIRSAKDLALSKGVVASTPWLSVLSDKEILRFLRHHNGNRDEAWKSIKNHAAWRTSPYGSETIVKANRFQDSVLNREIFWLGVSNIGCPTLVIRTQAHDGADYQEDPKTFTSFFVWILEQGRIKYGAIDHLPVCVILDRGAFYRNGQRKGDKPDFSVIPRLVELFKNLYSVVNNNYPEILAGAKVVPASFFFKMCYKITSRVMDSKTRNKFSLVASDKVASEIGALFPSTVLPPHMGGSSKKGGLWDDGQWDRPEALAEMMDVLHDKHANKHRGTTGPSSTSMNLKSEEEAAPRRARNSDARGID